MLLFGRMQIREQLLYEGTIEWRIGIAENIGNRFGLQANTKFEICSSWIWPIGRPGCKEALLIQTAQHGLELVGCQLAFPLPRRCGFRIAEIQADMTITHDPEDGGYGVETLFTWTWPTRIGLEVGIDNLGCCLCHIGEVDGWRDRNCRHWR